MDPLAHAIRFNKTWLSAVIPFAYTGAVLIGVAAVLIVIGAASGPETKDVEF